MEHGFGEVASAERMMQGDALERCATSTEHFGRCFVAPVSAGRRLIRWVVTWFALYNFSAKHQQRLASSEPTAARDVRSTYASDVISLFTNIPSPTVSNHIRPPEIQSSLLSSVFLIRAVRDIRRLSLPFVPHSIPSSLYTITAEPTRSQLYYSHRIDPHPKNIS